ncbi:hypothetical protein ACFL6P_04105 [Candidatus Latescibacterota bacterium]
MDYPPEFHIEYLVLAIEQKYGIKIELDDKLRPHDDPPNYSSKQLDKMEGFIKGFVEGVKF